MSLGGRVAAGRREAPRPRPPGLLAISRTCASRLAAQRAAARRAGFRATARGHRAGPEARSAARGRASDMGRRAAEGAHCALRAALEVVHSVRADRGFGLGRWHRQSIPGPQPITLHASITLKFAVVGRLPMRRALEQVDVSRVHVSTSSSSSWASARLEIWTVHGGAVCMCLPEGPAGVRAAMSPRTFETRLRTPREKGHQAMTFGGGIFVVHTSTRARDTRAGPLPDRRRPPLPARIDCEAPDLRRPFAGCWQASTTLLSYLYT